MKKIILILFLVSCLLFLIFRPKEKVNIQILNYGSEVGQVMLSYNLEKIPSQVTYLLESERVGDANFTSDAKGKIDNHNIGKISREIVVNVGFNEAIVTSKNTKITFTSNGELNKDQNVRMEKIASALNGRTYSIKYNLKGHILGLKINSDKNYGFKETDYNTYDEDIKSLIVDLPDVHMGVGGIWVEKNNIETLGVSGKQEDTYEVIKIDGNTIFLKKTSTQNFPRQEENGVHISFDKKTVYDLKLQLNSPFIMSSQQNEQSVMIGEGNEFTVKTSDKVSTRISLKDK